MNELALFAGIGGIGLGLKRAFERRGLPFRTVCYVEWDDYCVEVLKARMRDGLLDDAPIWGDITTFDGRPWAGLVDIVTGGFPCQDLSFAGKGAGLEGKRSGLFFELMRVVREVRPGIVLLENVPALLIRGFGRVAAEMAASGYDLQWDCIPAAAVGAPHRRDRVFILAIRGGWLADASGEHGSASINHNIREARCAAEDRKTSKAEGRGRVSGRSLGDGCCAHVADAAGNGGERSGVARGRRAGSENGGEDVADTAGQRMEGDGTAGFIFARAPTEAGLSGCNGAGRGTNQWATEPDVGRVADGVPRRVDRLRALGNAVVPQVAEYVGERLIDWLYGSENG